MDYSVMQHLCIQISVWRSKRCTADEELCVILNPGDDPAFSSSNPESYDENPYLTE